MSRDRIERDLDDEIASHLQHRVDALVAHGMSRVDAEREAVRRFGPLDVGRADMLAAARHRERVLTLRDRLDGLIADVAYTGRQIRRAPALTVTVAATFALGVGANATMFGVVDQMLLRPPAHVSEPDRVVRPATMATFRGESFASTGFGYPGYVAVRDNTQSFASVACHTFPNPISLGLGASAQRVQHMLVCGNYFQTLGPRMRLGRPLLPDDDILPSGSNVVVISYGLWQRELGGDLDVIGQRLSLASRPYTIVGVAPRGFTGATRRPVDVWIPISAGEGLRFGGPQWATEHNSTWMSAVARLKPGVTPEAAGHDVLSAVRSYRQGIGKPDTASRAATLASLLPRSQPTLSAQSKVALLLGAVSLLVLLIACANVANLLLARALRRRREIAVRLALGISRTRLVRQLLLEGLALALIGGVAALLVVRAGSALVQQTILSQFAWADSPLDARVLGFTLAATVAVGLLAAIVPALQASAPDLSRTLKEGSRGAGVTHSRTRVALLLVQGALSVVLLSGTGLFVQSLSNVSGVDLGLELDQLVIGRIDLMSVGIDGAAGRDYFQQAAEQIRHVPGVRSVTIAEAAPFSDWQMGTGLAIPGRDSVPRFEQGPNKHGVDVHYFQTVGTRVLRGRPFAESDLVTGAEPVVIINDQAAKLLWPGEDAVGKCVRITDRGPVQPCARIVGVAEDTHASQVLERGTRAQVYMPIGMQQNSGPRAYALIVRAEGPEAIIDPMRRLMQTVLPGLPFANVRPMTAMLDEELRPWRLGATMFGVFGCIALLLAALGLYSVIAYSVAQRMHEMGVRVALGAQTGSLVRLVMRQALVLAGAGLAIGLALTLGGGKWVKPLLYEVSPREPRVLSIVAIVLLIAALTASLVPALRAGRANPIDALRSD